MERVAYIKNEIIAKTRNEVKELFNRLLEVYKQKGLTVSYKKIRIVTKDTNYCGKYEIGITVNLERDKDKVRVIH